MKVNSNDIRRWNIHALEMEEIQQEYEKSEKKCRDETTEPQKQWEKIKSSIINTADEVLGKSNLINKETEVVKTKSEQDESRLRNFQK